MRTERDSMGEVSVPDDAYYGASTQRAVDNFPISDLRFGRRFIWALGLIKGSAAEMNASMGIVGEEQAEADRRRQPTNSWTGDSTISLSSTSSRPDPARRRT